MIDVEDGNYFILNNETNDVLFVSDDKELIKNKFNSIRQNIINGIEISIRNISVGKYICFNSLKGTEDYISKDIFRTYCKM